MMKNKIKLISKSNKNLHTYTPSDISTYINTLAHMHAYKIKDNTFI